MWSDREKLVGEKQRFDCVLENYYDLAIVTKSKLIENTSETAVVTDGRSVVVVVVVVIVHVQF